MPCSAVPAPVFPPSFNVNVTVRLAVEGFSDELL
jgi:hypothetical protein